MIKTIVREHHWKPSYLSKLYLDDADYLGLEYWYNDVVEVGEEIAKKNKK